MPIAIIMVRAYATSGATDTVAGKPLSLYRHRQAHATANISTAVNVWATQSRGESLPRRVGKNLPRRHIGRLSVFTLELSSILMLASLSLGERQRSCMSTPLPAAHNEVWIVGTSAR